MRLALKLSYGVAAVISLANGIWMLWSPSSWYAQLPAARSTGRLRR
jgi:hypothetical protein